MAFSDAFLEELAQRNDIVDVVSSYVNLSKRSGSNLFGLCPFHSEKTPSFSVAPDKQIYHCFGCGKGGGVISFIMEVENLSFPEAVEFLARRANMPMPEEEHSGESSRRKRMLELNKDAARWFYQQLISENGLPGQNYVLQRGISRTMVKNFGLGYAPDTWNSLTDAMKAKGYSEKELFDTGLMKKGRNGGGYDAFRGRLMFPVIDVRGSVIGFSGRIIGDGEPKYLNSPETLVFSKRSNLFGLNLAKKSKSGYIILTEGNIDVVSLHQAGFDSAVASLGTSFTAEQARLINRYVNEVVLCYDGDAAGHKAAERAIGILQKLDMKVRVLEMKGAKDPDEFIRANGADAFRNLIEGSAGQVEYRLKAVEEKYPPTTEEGRVNYLKEAARLLSTLPGDVEREVYAAKAAEKGGVSSDAVLREINRLRKARLREAHKKEMQTQSRPTQTVQPAERELRYEDPRSARAEEGIIRLLYLDPSLSDSTELPPEEDFSSPLLRRLYAVLLRRAKERQSISLSVLAADFDSAELSHFTRIIGVPEDLSRGKQALRDYIEVIRLQRSGGDDLRALAETLRQKSSKYTAEQNKPQGSGG